MNNEIKEILAEIKDNINETPKRMFKCNKVTFNLEESQLLLDYITNLQEDLEYSDYCNEQLRKKITNLEYKINLLQGEDKDVKD